MNTETQYPSIPAQFKEDWLKALRSGKYEQTKEFLFTGYKYCCLGVACVVGGASEEDLRDEQAVKSHLHSYVPGAIWDRHNSDNLHDTLANMNDKGNTFPQIADWIEKNVPTHQP